MYPVVAQRGFRHFLTLQFKKMSRLSASESETRSQGLDGIRGFAAGLVFLAHLDSASTFPFLRLFGGGIIGVDVFCVLSGFFITTILFNEWSLTKRINLKKFYLRRASRVLPAVVLLFLAVIPFSYSYSGTESIYDLLSFGLLGYNYWMISQCVERASQGHLWPHLWSISLEEQFYLIWPFMFVFIVRIFTKKWTIILLALLPGIISSIWRMSAFGSGDASMCGWMRPYLATDCRLFSLSFGCALALAVRTGAITAWSKLLQSAFYISLLLVTVVITQLYYRSTYLFYGGFEIASIFSGLLILKVIFDPKSKTNRVLSFLPFSSFGKISYGFYLWHYPIIQSGRNDSLLELAMVFCVTLIISILSYTILERPIMRLIRDRYSIRSFINPSNTTL
jgi:peptidoglycan/LPS O-acetylase OafA/YrhL